MLHGVEKESPEKPEISLTKTNTTSLSHFTGSEGTNEILHKIASVRMFRSDGSSINTHVMFDDCSDLTMIDDRRRRFSRSQSASHGQGTADDSVDDELFAYRRQQNHRNHVSIGER